MSLKKKDFYGKEVAETIKKACEEFNVPQEDLDIEVIETGSTGIFGLIRKKTHIRAAVKVERDREEVKAPEKEPAAKEKEKEPVKEEPVKEVPESAKEVPESVQPKKDTVAEESDAADGDTPVEEIQLSEEDVDSISRELSQILDLMGYPAKVLIEADGNAVSCTIESELEEVLIGKDGKTLDSMQYLLRKMIARRIPHRLRLSVDVGNYRERRREELKVKAVELAAQVKKDGKTQVIPALSPSERRVVHMTLQSDKEIRSRSVGDGLFKKILIYKPGKGKKGGGRKYSRGRKGGSSRQKKAKE